MGVMEVKEMSMTSQEQATALKELDTLYDQATSFRSWLAEGSEQRRYGLLKDRIEQATPGLRVKRVDLTYRYGHVLAPIDEEPITGEVHIVKELQR